MKRGRGRPRKNPVAAAPPVSEEKKRGRGRPPKSGKGKGRPPKSATVATTGEPRPRGRPRKNAKPISKPDEVSDDEVCVVM